MEFHIKDLSLFQVLILLSESETDSENQSVEGRIPIMLGPSLLDNTPDTTRPEVDDSKTDPSSSEDDVPLIPIRRSTQQKRPTQSCTVCNSVSQPAENEIPAVLGPAPLDDTLNATRPNADDPSIGKSLPVSDAPVALLRWCTQQKRAAPSCTVCDQNEGV